MDSFPLMIHNARKPAGWLEVFNPFDLSPIARVATCDSHHVEQALTTADKLYSDRQRWLPLDQRISIFHKLVELVSSQKETLALEAAREGGKPLLDSQVEINRAIEGLRLCIEAMSSGNGSMPVVNASAATRHHLAFTTLEPIGVVVAVSAFNHPFNLIVHQVGPAIAAGCPVIVKPADDTPLSCLRLAKLFYEAGLPEEWLQVAVTDSIPVAEHLVTARRVAFFSFIGSAKVGWMLRSKLAPGVRCALEHGGVAPAIVAKDADIDAAVTALVKGGFYHAGQVCVSTQRIFVDKEISAEFLKAMINKTGQLVTGNACLAKTDVGPLIRPNEVDRIESWVKEAIDTGAELLCGGQRINDTCFAPTILFNPPEQATISQQEVFGPVVCVYDFEDMDQAIRQANNLPFAFQAAVFSNHQPTILKAYKQLDASAVMVNQHTAFRTDGMPFAGLKQSGLGVGGIEHTFRDMQIEKMMVIYDSGL